MRLEQGSVVAQRFRLLRPLGAGGMGTVWVAHDARLDTPCAVKFLQEGAVETPDARARFEREARAAARLRSPNVVQILDHGEHAGVPYIAMELLVGEDLSQRLHRAFRLSPRETLAIVTQVGRALTRAHAAGVVHRDLKPANVFLVADDDGEVVKVLDFGIAKSLALGAPQSLRAGSAALAAGAAATMTGMLLGTPSYMSPEQIAHGSVDTRSDLWSLGVVAFKCLTGRAPFVSDDVADLLIRIQLDPVPRPSAIVPELPAAVDAWLGRALARDPDERFQLARELSDALHVALGADAPAAAGPSSRPDTLAVERPASGGATSMSQRRTSGRVVTDDERRMMSVVVVRPRGAAGVEPDDLRGVAAVARGSGARVEALANGALVLGFAAGGAATDGAMRAARCALELRRRFHGVALAISTEALLVAADARGAADLDAARDGASLATADAALLRVPDVAASLGARGGVSIDVTTAQLLDATFEVQSGPDGHSLVGERAALIGEEHARIASARTLLGRPTSCVGRERELSILLGMFEECAGDSVARCALVVGPPGIGKSRVQAEFLRRLSERGEGVTVTIARGDAVGKNSPFGFAAQLVRDAASIYDAEPLAVRQAKIDALIARDFEGDERTRLVQFLAELVSAPFDDAGSTSLRAARVDARLMNDQINAALEALLAAECRRRPVVVVFEDLQWGDLPTVNLADAALRRLRASPLMILALARPEVTQVFPKLWADRSVTEVRLGELSSKACERLARDALPDASDDVVSRIAATAGGNAFYLEELIRAHAAGGDQALPNTVVAMVQARLDALEPDARRVLRAASVFGQVFWKGGLAASLGVDAGAGDAALSGRLDQLARKEILERKTSSGSAGAGRFAGEEEYAFCHALVREAAYAMLTDGDRALCHAHAGAWLERAGETDARTLAEHYERGGARDPAQRWYLRAGEQAMEGNDFLAALAFAERAATLGATGEALGRARGLQAEAQRWLGMTAEGSANGFEAMALLTPGTPLWCHAANTTITTTARLGAYDKLPALAEALLSSPAAHLAPGSLVCALSKLATGFIHGGALHEADRILAEALRVVPMLPAADVAPRALLELGLGIRRQMSGDPCAALACYERAADAFARCGDRRTASVEGILTACSLMELGGYARAAEVLRRVVVDADALGLVETRVLARQNASLVLLALGDLDGARAAAEEAVAAHDAAGEARAQAASTAYLARVVFAQGDVALAEALASRAIEFATVVPPTEAYALAVRAMVRLRAGRVTEALADAARADAHLTALGGHLEEGESLIRLALAEALTATGDHAAAASAIAIAGQRLRERAARIDDETLRRSFLDDVPENRATAALCGAALG